MTVRVRFAPSPTGYVHIGSLRTALYNYLFARKHNGVFVLRIEDTDRSRFVPGATESLVEALEWAGINIDEGPGYGGDFGPYFQSQRTDVYRKHLKTLLDSGVAYYAFDTPEEIAQMREKMRNNGIHTPKYDYTVRDQMRNSLTLSESQVNAEIDKGTPYVIRLRVPENRMFSFVDRIRGEVEFGSDQVDDQVLLKSDGYPTYHLANVIDDHLMQITHIIRGEEWLSSVPKHLLLYELFGWQAPEMAHLPLIFNPDGSKMSKRHIQNADDPTSGKANPDVQSYRKRGYENNALINYIALLGWNPGKAEAQEVFMPEELVHAFSLDRVNKSRAIFDLDKLNWLNKEHLSRQPTHALVRRLKPQLRENKIDFKSDEYLYQVVDLLKSRLHFLHDFIDYSRYFFRDPDVYEEKGVRKRWKNDSAKLVLEFCQEISKLESFNAKSIENTLRQVTARYDVGAGRLIHPVRLAVTGVTVGPGLFELLQVLGKETVMHRLKRAVEQLPSPQN